VTIDDCTYLGHLWSRNEQFEFYLTPHGEVVCHQKSDRGALWAPWKDLDTVTDGGRKLKELVDNAGRAQCGHITGAARR
jgi:hypothetical protein